MKRKTHTIVNDPKFYVLPVNQTPWQPSVLIEAPDKKSKTSLRGFPVLDHRIARSNFFSDNPVTNSLEGHGLTGMLFHDRYGCQVKSTHALQKFYTNQKNKDFFKNIEDLWKTQWTVTDRSGRSVLYENSPFMKALRTGRTCRKLLRIKMKNGETSWLYFHSQHFHTGIAGENDYVVSTVIDITNEKLLIDKARGTENRLQSFMNQVPSLSWIINEQGDLLFANDAFYNYFDLREKSAIGKKLVDLLPVAVTNKLYDKHLKVLNTGKSIQTKERVELADGSGFEAYIDIFLLRGPDGEKMIAGQSYHLVDKIRDKLNDIKSKKLLILNHAISDAIWEWDMKSGHIYRNESLMKMIGYEEELFSGLSWWLRHIHPDDQERIATRVKAVAAKQEPSWQEQYRFKCADGHYKHVQDRGYVIYENGIAVRMIGSLTDISKVKELENELINEKLRRQTELAETVIRVQEMERTRFGHELHDNINQILSSAKLFIDLLKPGDQKQIEIKGKGIEYVTLAIEEIRKLSKELVVPHLKQQGLINGILTLVNDLDAASPVKFTFIHNAEEEYELIGAGKKVTLFRIVQEQVKNILKYSKASEAGICLHLKNSVINLSIWDNGIGFVPHNTQSGIGLSNIRERVSFYNGTVEIVSAPNEGCRLNINLPVA